jgi:hypothetical protein
MARVFREYKNEKGELHRDGGLPAIEWVDGGKSWYVNGRLHREPLHGSDGVEGLPAIEQPNGDKSWWINGKRHRGGGLPARETNGDKYWYVDGKYHRDGGLPAIEYANGDKYWYVDGKCHRTGGLPAVIINGDKSWWVDGKCHRDGGLPARERANGDKEWWVNGVNITSFREKYQEVHRIRAQKRIYFWIIPILYRPGSDSAKRLSEASWQKTLKEMEEFQN